jgi:asparagine synthase (glutamine-hydrolysing)
MCGIYGAVSCSGRPLGRPEVVARLGEALRHRGPDGHDLLAAPAGAIGCRRLRIVDLDPRADQPFASPGAPADAVWLACNGEVYNAPALRRRFADYPYRSKSDVETVVPLYLADGAAAVPQLDGMFGLAIWDRRTGALFLARDRAGEKPLFYAAIGGEVWFASEVQALLEHPEISRDLDPVALSQYLTLGYVLEPRTMFAAVRRVEAGTVVRFDRDGAAPSRYWHPAALARAPAPAGRPEERVADLFQAAVAKQVMADVPVGVFTSGGLDSSLLAVLAARALGPERVHTFAVRFAAPSYDESAGARWFARRFGTRYVEVVADETTLGEALARVTAGLAEPLADPAVLPTWLLAKAAREHVTVILSGEGADELFGGYPTYLGQQAARWLGVLPRPLRRALAALVARLPASDRKVTLEYLLKRFFAELEKPWGERHLAWFGSGLGARLGVTGDAWRDELFAGLPAIDPLAGAMLLDYTTYLRDDLLVKVDRATMLSSIEARAPYLDRDLTAYALALPARHRVRGLTSKWVLKRAAARWLPREVTGKRKRGLSVPVAAWLNDGLSGEVDRLLDPARLRRQGLIDPAPVAALLAEHRAGRANHARALWTLIVLQRWLERWGGG